MERFLDVLCKGDRANMCDRSKESLLSLMHKNNYQIDKLLTQIRDAKLPQYPDGMLLLLFLYYSLITQLQIWWIVLCDLNRIMLKWMNDWLIDISIYNRLLEWNRTIPLWSVDLYSCLYKEFCLNIEIGKSSLFSLYV